MFIAAFVAASSLGMAAGPFLAIPLKYMNPCKLLGFTINNVTMAGWFMAVIWVLFLVTALLFFYEPLRKQKLQVCIIVHTCFSILSYDAFAGV